MVDYVHCCFLIMMRNEFLPGDFMLAVEVNCGKGCGGRDGEKLEWKMTVFM